MNLLPIWLALFLRQMLHYDGAQQYTLTQGDHHHVMPNDIWRNLEFGYQCLLKIMCTKSGKKEEFSMTFVRKRLPTSHWVIKLGGRKALGHAAPELPVTALDELNDYYFNPET